MTTLSRRCFQFSLRTIFVLLTLGCCWVSHQLNWIRAREKFRSSHESELERLHTYKCPPSLPVTPPGSLWMLGEMGAVHVALRDRGELEEAQRLFPEAAIYLP